LQRISARQQIAKQLDPNNLQSLQSAYTQLQQLGDYQGLQQLLPVIDAATKRQQELKAQRNILLAQTIGAAAYQPATESEQQYVQVDEQGQPTMIPARPSSFDVSRVAPELMALGPAGVAQLKLMQEAQALTQPKTISVKEGETLYSVPTTPGAEFKPVLSGGAKPTPFTGETANAANILYRTTDPQKIFAQYGQEGLNAVAKKAEQLAENKRPVVNVTANMMQKGFGENLTDTITANLKAGRSAASTIGTVDNMKMLLDEGVKTGFGQETLLKLGQAGQLFDPNFNTKGLAGQEAFQAFSTQIVLPQVKQLGANPTDTDLKFIVTGAAGLAKTVEGNKLLLDTLALKLKREQDLSKFSNQWLGSNGALAQANPIQAQVKFNNDFDSYIQSSPLYGASANTLRSRYLALGGPVRGSAPARSAAQAGGFTR
jgi:hypothetical protein